MEDRVLTAKQKNSLRAHAKLREASIRRHVTAYGVEYPTLTHAAAATGFSIRAVDRYAKDPRHTWIYFTDTVAKRKVIDV